jgi:hypothetical protein
MDSKEVTMRRTQLPVITQIVFVCGLALVLASLACSLVTPGGIGLLTVPQEPPEQPADAGAEAEEAAPAETIPEESGSGSEPYSGEFLEADCSCAGYEPSYVLPWGNTGLTCRYEWSGPNIDGNSLSFEVDRYYHEDQLLPDFEQEVQGLTSSYGTLGADPWQAEELRNDDEGYVFLSYGPGGSGNSGEIPLCGNGRGVFQYAGKFMISTQLFACDLPYSEQAYANALADMETCARRAIERIK